MTLYNIKMLRACLPISVLLTGFTLCHAKSTTKTQAEKQIQQLTQQITQLKQNLHLVHNKQDKLHQSLKHTEIEIGTCVHQLTRLQQAADLKQKKINALQYQTKQLNQQLTDQQTLFQKHVLARYKLSNVEPVKVILNQQDPYKISQTLTFYKYFVQYRQAIINKMELTKSTLTKHQKTLATELTKQQAIKQKIDIHQKQLEHTKRQNQTVMNTIDKDIQTKQNKLLDAERNKKNLAHLLKSLFKQQAINAQKPITTMQHRLPRPVQVAYSAMKTMNQGVTFFAAEGTAVHAVYSGRVVFSDWLRGYGLLLIIDHGNGLMTLYAHNQALFKNKGTTVAQGEQIAAVGHTGGLKENGLYFEVRQRGKAVSPAAWLS